MNSILIKNLNCHCCILVYDVTDEDSFNWCGKAIEKIYKISKDIRIMLIGNKIDLENKRVISKEDGYNLSLEYNTFFMETSCKYYYNVVNAFETIIIETYNFLKNNKKI